MSIGDRALGAGFGAAIALVAGQLGPQLGFPEEILTVPLGAVLGGIIGARAIEKKVGGLL